MSSPFDLLPIIIASQQADMARQAAAEATRKENERFEYFKKQNEEDRAASAPILQGIRDTLDANRKAAEEDRARYKATFQPIEDQLVSDALSYASPERKMLEIGKATSMVSNQMEGQRRAATRNLEGFGIDPGAVRYAGLDANMRALTGAAQAAAGNQASQNVDNVARQLRAQAISVGQGYPGQIAQAYQTGTNAGNSALQGINNLTGMAANTLGTPVQYGSLASNYMSNANQALGVMNQGYGGYYNQQNAGGGSGWGSMLGLLGGAAIGGFMGGPAGAAAMGSMGSKFGSFFNDGGGSLPTKVVGGAGDLPVKTFFNEEGGMIPEHASPTSGAAIDDVPARLTVGEFVIPKDTLQWKGEEFFQKLIAQSRKAKDEAVAKPEIGVAPQQPPTFVSRPQGAPTPPNGQQSFANGGAALPMRLPYGQRYNPETDALNAQDAKGIGFRGPISNGGHIVSEYSSGRDIQYPSVYSGINNADLAAVLTAERLRSPYPGDDIISQHLNSAASKQFPFPEDVDERAYRAAMQRVHDNKSPFWDQRVDAYPAYSPDQYWGEPSTQVPRAALPMR